MLKAVRAHSSNTYALTFGHRSSPKGSLTWECSAPQLLPVSPLMLEWRWKQHKHKRVQREVNWWEEAMPIAKVKKEWWCDEGRTVEKGRAMEEDKEERGGLLCCILTGDTLHMSTSVVERPPYSQSNVTLISSGLKEANNNPNDFSSFYSHPWRRDVVMRTSFREL